MCAAQNVEAPHNIEHVDAAEFTLGLNSYANLWAQWLYTLLGSKVATLFY